MKTQGYEVKKFSGPTKRYCQALNLKDDKDLIEAYCRIHSKEKAWPEIRAGIREVGILEMEIYILGNQLFMIVETPADFDWETAMNKLATLPRQAEWEEYVARFQQCAKQASSDEKWKMMERMFYLYD